MLRDQELVCNLLVVNLALKAGKMGEIMLRFEEKGHAGFLFFGDFFFVFYKSRTYDNPEYFFCFFLFIFFFLWVIKTILI